MRKKKRETPGSIHEGIIIYIYILNPLNAVIYRIIGDGTN